MSSATGFLRQALRSSLLPIRPGMEFNCGRALGKGFKEIGVRPEDYLNWLNVEIGLWKEQSKPSKKLRNIYSSVLAASGDEVGTAIAANYFVMHRALIVDNLMSHEQATAFLGYLLLMYDLAIKERLSSAQISRLLSSRNENVTFSRQAVNSTLQKIKATATISDSQLKRLYSRDSAFEVQAFADADIEMSAAIVADSGKTLGTHISIEEPLKVLALPDKMKEYVPYIQMLHYQCAICEYYDHAITDLYEFSPRGKKGNWLFQQYPAAMAGAGNPFLNNAKSVERLGLSWVRSKKRGERPGAKSLHTILVAMESMGFAARRELARLIRMWIHRMIRLSAPYAVLLPDELTADQLQKLLEATAGGNTGTYGIIEQRVLDVISLQLHPESAGWRSRGLGASVNATNVSQRKFGDCDFQHAANKRIVAYEAHGGKLSPIYVAEHIRTLELVIIARLPELLGIANAEEWTTEIVFIAHELTGTFPTRATVGGLEINITVRTFADIIAETNLSEDLLVNFRTHLLRVLGENRTPREVRQTLLNLIA